MRLSLCVLLAAALGCQTYDFEPVEPLAIAQTTRRERVVSLGRLPNVMLVVDKSGSMADPIPGGGTRISELKTAMGGFLDTYGTVARFGLTTYPEVISTLAVPACGVGRLSIDVSLSDDVPSDLTAKAAQIKAAVQAITAGGGTPTATTLASLANYPPLRDPNRQDFALLLTDGLPNCNANNPSSPATCTCTGALPCSINNCLDQDATVASIRELKKAEITTIVVGFGADLGSGPGPAVLQAMAAAGGFQRSCKAQGDCGVGDSCVNGLCGRQYFQAANGAELGKALEAIRQIFPTACEFTLDARPPDPRLLVVMVDGVDVASAPDTWSYTEGKVIFAKDGAICGRLKTATEDHPVNVEIRVIEAL
jgi:hypothetical protein